MRASFTRRNETRDLEPGLVEEGPCDFGRKDGSFSLPSLKVFSQGLGTQKGGPGGELEPLCSGPVGGRRRATGGGERESGPLRHALRLALCVCLSSCPLEAPPQAASTGSSFCLCPLASASRGRVVWRLGSTLLEVAEHLHRFLPSPSAGPPSSRSPYLGADDFFFLLTSNLENNPHQLP